MKKAIALALSILMLLSVLAGCSSPAKTPAADAAAPSSAEKQTTAADEPVKLRLLMYGDNSERRDEYFKNEFHDAVLEALNIDFSVEWLPWSDYSAGGTTITNMLAAGEGFAFENITSLTDWHTRGYVAEIPVDEIEANMAEYLAMRGENNGFECCKYEGKIYCIPIGAKAYSGAHQSITVRNELLNEAGWDYADIKTYDDFVAAIEAVKALHPEMSVMRENGSLCFALASTLVDGWSLGEPIDDFVIVNESEDGDTVYSYYESELFKQFAYLMQDWVARGWQTQDAIVNPGQTVADWNAGNTICMFGTPGNLIEQNVKAAFPDADLKNVKIGDQPYVKTRDYDWGISVSAGDAEHVGDWLRLINWIYKDEATYNFCVYGVEGKDWERAGDGSITRLVSESFWDDWFLQASCYIQYDKSIPQENIDQYLNYDEGSVISKAAGFAFDSSSVETERALLSAVKTEYLDAMELGFLDYDTNYADVQARLKEAGIDKYVAEYQRQFSEWKAAQ